jgi:hypothetical protein
MHNDQIKPRRTWLSNAVWKLPGGNEDNDLWSFVDLDADTVTSTWVPTDEQRQRIADGGNIDLVVWGQMPPVALMVNDTTPLGAPPNEGTDSTD